MFIPLVVVGLALITSTIALIGGLQATQHTVKPLVSALHSGLGWLPGVGTLIAKVEKQIYASLDVATKQQQTALRDAIIAAESNHLGNVQTNQKLGHAIESALQLLVASTIPSKIGAATTGAATGVNAVNLRVDALSTKERDDIAALAAEIDANHGYSDTAAGREASKAETAAKSYTDTKITGVDDALKKLTDTTIPGLIADDIRSTGVIGEAIADAVAGAPYLKQAQVDTVVADALKPGGTISDSIAAAVENAHAVTAQGVETAIVNDLKPGGAIHDEITKLLAGIPQPLTGPQGATGPPGPPGPPGAASGAGVSADDVAAAISDAISADLQPGGVISQAIAGVAIPPPPTTATPPPTSIAALAGEVAALAATQAIVLTESGLDNSACRAKNKQICGSDSNLWSDLIGALIVTAIALDWKEMARIAALGGQVAAGALQSIA